MPSPLPPPVPASGFPDDDRTFGPGNGGLLEPAMVPPPPPPIPEGGFAEDVLSPRDSGLGTLNVLADEVVSLVLSLLTPTELDRMAQVSRVLYIFSRDDALWRAHSLDLKLQLTFQGTWRATFIHSLPPSTKHDSEWTADDPEWATSPEKQRRRLPANPSTPLDASTWNVRSQFLHRRWAFSNLDPAAAGLDRIRPDGPSTLPVLDPRSDSVAVARHLALGMPFTMPASATSHWPARTTWSSGALRKTHGSTAFRAGAGTENNTSRSIRHADMFLSDYLDYCQKQHDESPLYVFDPNFGSKAPALLADYTPFEFMSPDLMLKLDPRPMDFRWFVLGPARSGATWHMDPFGTSAWNSLLSGRKRWALYPPGQPPPGVRIADGKLDAPSSLAWFLDVYPNLGAGEMPIELVQGEGETVYVPSGWWHLILNLDQINVAVTQNFLLPRSARQFAGEGAMRLPPPIFSRVAEQFGADDPALEGLMSEAAELFQPSKDPFVRESGFMCLAEMMGSFRSAAAFKEQLAAIERQTGVKGPWTSRGGTSPVFVSVSGEVVKLFPPFAASGKVCAGEVVSRARLGDWGLAPEIVGSGLSSEQEGWGWPFVVMKAAQGMDFAEHRARTGLKATVETAEWLGKTLKRLHGLPAVELGGQDARSHVEWTAFVSRLFDGTFEARCGRLPEAVEEAVLELRTKPDLERWLAAIPPSHRATMLHSDLHDGNIFGTPSETGWAPKHVIDFGDSFHLSPPQQSSGAFLDAAWDFVPLFCSVLSFDSTLIMAFLDAYGIEPEDRRTVLGRTLCFALIWEFGGAVDAVVARAAEWEGDTGDAVEMIWGL